MWVRWTMWSPKRKRWRKVRSDERVSCTDPGLGRSDFFDGDCEFMVVPCTDGAMGILSHHSNMIAAVVPGELRFQPVGGPLRTAAVSAGLVKVEDGGGHASGVHGGAAGGH